MLNGLELESVRVLIDNSARAREKKIRLGRGIAGWAAEKRQTALTVNAATDPRFDREVDAISTNDPFFLLSAPMRTEWACLGVIALARRADTTGFSDEDATSLQTIADFAATALWKARRIEELDKLSIRDEETGLYNSRGFERDLDFSILWSEMMVREQISEALEEFSLIGVSCQGLKKNLSVCFTYDQFRQVLAQIGNALKSACETGDSAYRRGECEFVLILKYRSPESASAMCKRAQQLLGDGLDFLVWGASEFVTAQVTYPCRWKK